MKEYIKDLEYGAFGFEGTVHSDLFNVDIPIRSRKCDREYVERCAMCFAQMSEELKTKLLRATAAYALENVEQYGIDDPDIVWDFTEDSPLTDITKFMYPVVINIPQPKYMTEQDAPPCFDFEFTCVWELEQGGEWLVRGDEALYVGSFEGNSPWDFTDEDWNYINKI